jgi:hypothetical protein
MHERNPIPHSDLQAFYQLLKVTLDIIMLVLISGQQCGSVEQKRTGKSTIFVLLSHPLFQRGK